MSSKISWLEPKTRCFLLIFLAFAALIQLLTTFYTVYYFPINSMYIFIFVSLGVTVLLMGVELLFSELVHSIRMRRRQKKRSKKRKKLKRLTLTWSIVIGAGLSLGIYVMFFFIFAYFIMDPLSLTFLPIYGKFSFVVLLSGIVIIITLIIFENLFPKS